MKVVINKCYGGFSISPEAVVALAARKGVEINWFANVIDSTTDDLKLVPVSFEEAKDERMKDGRYMLPHAIIGNDPDSEGSWFENRPEDRADPDLVAVVEELGAAANGRHAELAVVEIPDDVEYQIDEYDGIEWVAEKHRTWS